MRHLQISWIYFSLDSFNVFGKNVLIISSLQSDITKKSVPEGHHIVSGRYLSIIGRLKLPCYDSNLFKDYETFRLQCRILHSRNNDFLLHFIRISCWITNLKFFWLHMYFKQMSDTRFNLYNMDFCELFLKRFLYDTAKRSEYHKRSTVSQTRRTLFLDRDICNLLLWIVICDYSILVIEQICLILYLYRWMG